jgi:phosphatidylglycerophosphatase A
MVSPQSQQHSHAEPPNALIWIKTCLATVFGIGFLPKMPGTFGSAVTILPIFFLSANTHGIMLGVAICSFLLGLWSVPLLEERWGDDPPRVVIDEVLGMSLSLASPIIPHTAVWILLAFVLFRVFDITKPFPINRVNAKSGAFYVMIDDVIAALYALLVLHLAWLIHQLHLNSLIP